jgi:hypothetical protein
MARKSIGRTLIEPRKGDKRYLRRNETGQFKTEVNVGRSLAADRRRKAKSKAPKAQRDQQRFTVCVIKKRTLVRYAHRDMGREPVDYWRIDGNSRRVSKRLSTTFYGNVRRTFLQPFQTAWPEGDDHRTGRSGYMEVNKAWQSERPTRQSSGKKRGRIR